VSVCTVMCQLNASWRLVLLHDNDAWKNAAWSVEHLSDDGEWHSRHAVRSRELLLGFVQHRCGDIDPAATAILSALPDRVDLRPASERPPRYVRKRKPSHSATGAVPEVTRKADPKPVSQTTRKFVDWRSRQNHGVT
jgi:hypothetical protein